MSQLEFDITEWLLNNKEGLVENIIRTHNPAYKLLPDVLFDIYLDNYSNKVLNIIKQDLIAPFHLNPEELENITKEYIGDILGYDIFKP